MPSVPNSLPICILLYVSLVADYYIIITRNIHLITISTLLKSIKFLRTRLFKQFPGNLTGAGPGQGLFELYQFWELIACQPLPAK